MWELAGGEDRAWYGQLGRVQLLDCVQGGHVQQEGGGLPVQGGHDQLQGGEGHNQVQG